MVQFEILCFIFFVLEFSIISAHSETDLLSKFHQNDYKIEFQRMELNSYDKSAWNLIECKTFKFNRTTPAVNLTLNPKKNYGDKLEVVVQVYKFVSNEYRTFPIRFQVNVCKSIKREAIGLGVVYKCGNYTKCEILKDVTYRICNFGIDQSRFPPFLPSGEFRAQLEFLDDNKIIATAYIFLKIYRPITIKD